MATLFEQPNRLAPAPSMALAVAKSLIPPEALTPIWSLTTWRISFTSSIVAPPVENPVEVLTKSVKEPGSILYTITDGEIENWPKIRAEFKKFIGKHNYVHFQIGEDTKMTSDLESWKIPVVKITDASSMPKKAVILTKSLYRSYS